MRQTPDDAVSEDVFKEVARALAAGGRRSRRHRGTPGRGTLSVPNPKFAPTSRQPDLRTSGSKGH